MAQLGLQDGTGTARQCLARLGLQGDAGTASREIKLKEKIETFQN
jgi:hypothetical protein